MTVPNAAIQSEANRESEFEPITVSPGVTLTNEREVEVWRKRTEEAIRLHLSAIIVAFGYKGEAGTEAFLAQLDEAVREVQIQVERSHRFGLSLECCSALACELMNSAEADWNLYV